MIKPKTIFTKISRYLQPLWALTLLLGYLSTAVGSAQAAGTATLSLSPDSGSYVSGSTFSVSVYEDSGSELINAAEADLSYDETKLEYVSSNYGTAFDFNLPRTNGSGIVMLTVAKLSGSTSGKQLIGSISFKALANTGSTSLKFDLKNTADQYTSGIIRTADTVNLWDQNLSGATYSFTGATVTPPTTPPPTTTTTKTTSTPKTTTTTTGTTTTTPSTTPGAPTEISSSAGHFVAISVTDPSSKPVVGADVSAAGFNVKTDAYGIATFTNLPAGSVEVTVKANGKTTRQTINVSSTAQAQDVQTFNVRVAGASTLGGRWYLYLLGLMLIALVLGGGLSLKRMMVARSQNLAMANQAGPPAASAPTAPPTTPSTGNAGAQVFYPDASVNAKSPTEDK